MRKIIAPILMLNLCFHFFQIFASTLTKNILSRGSHLSVEKFDRDVLYSPDNTFSCGFYKVGTNAFIFAIWYTNTTEKTITWRAITDQPVNGHGSKIALRKDGTLVLMDVDGTVVWRTNTTTTAAQTAELMNSGNLVVMNSDQKPEWQSFGSPTDTLLPSQPMTKDTTLVSASSANSLSSGYYKFYFDSDSKLALWYANPDYPLTGWPKKDNQNNYNISRIGFLDELGHFSASDQLNKNASDLGAKVKRRMTLDYDGNLRIYSLDESTWNWSVSWVAVTKPCEVYGICGPNGVCVYTQSKAGCSCPPGFERNDPSNWSKGCKRANGSSISSDQSEFKFLELDHVDFYGYQILNYDQYATFEECKNFCINHSSCEAFVYKQDSSGECYPKFALLNGRYSQRYTTFLKFPVSANVSSSSLPLQASELLCDPFSNDIQSNVTYFATNTVIKWVYFYWFLGIVFVLEAVIIFFGWWFMFRDQKPASTDEGYKMLWSQFRRFNYAELKTATKNFTDVIGRGGSGTVYKGVLDDGKVIAVKKLEDVFQGEEELQAELSLIGRINHKNLVRMIGYCSELSKRLLVSEFVELGSLDKVLFDDDNSQNLVIKWSDRFKIALGVAQGLAYLHHECLEWIIHCDVKPENILLGSDFEPKIADFGLAKLLNRNGTGNNLSMIRGTRGYIAPEWAFSLPITGKVDVYSFGVVLLELVKGSRVSNWVIESEGNVEMVLRRSHALLKEKMQSEEMEWIEEFVDLRLNGEFNKRQALLLIRVAVYCLEEERSKRPTMNTVFQMMLSYND